MMTRVCSGQSAPNRTKPFGLFFFCKSGRLPLLCRWLAIRAMLSEHEDVLNIVFDDCVRFVRLAKKSCSIAICFKFGVRNFVPENRRQIIEANPSSANTNIGVERQDKMSSFVFSPCNTNIANIADEPSARLNHPVAMSPNFIKLIKKVFVVVEITELSRVLVVFLQVEIRRRSHDCLNRIVSNPI